jgi:tetratricopeptide (TPR) repeat protein
VGPAGRLARWARRSPLTAGLLAALLVVLVGGLAGVTYLWRLAEANAETARREKAEADVQRGRAEEGFGQAREAVNEYFNKVSGSKALKTPGLEPLRKELLQAALTYYQDFLRQRADDPALQREVAWAHARVAQISRDNGDFATAAREAQQAATMYEQFVRDNPGDDALAQRLAWIYSELGMAQGGLDRRDEELQTYHKALAIRQRMAEAAPSDPYAQSRLAWSYANIAECLGGQGKLDEARPYFEKSCAFWQTSCAADPDSPWTRSQWALTCQNLGNLHAMQERHEEALRYYRQSHGLRLQLAGKTPDDPETRWQLAMSYDRLGNGCKETSRLPEALAAYEKARDLEEKMIRDYPAAAGRFRGALLDTCYGLTEVQLALGRPADAAATARRRRDLAPNDPDRLYGVACHLALCVPLIGKGKSEPTAAEAERRRCADEAMEVLRQAVAAGYKDWPPLEEDPDLAPLRGRPDYRELLKAKDGAAGGGPAGARKPSPGP